MCCVCCFDFPTVHLSRHCPLADMAMASYIWSSTLCRLPLASYSINSLLRFWSYDFFEGGTKTTLIVNELCCCGPCRTAPSCRHGNRFPVDWIVFRDDAVRYSSVL
ncbi:hypothetical protein NCU16827 [Neurospora crassa OR74A]|uniref:Uncharacterized protein n=1 Tax=Neurospora crassa (strain ATCC 24698 / 74-OR23-1A / CBS 708.71 / DSM 1257 / FGSC 987) TaxID=367110 RepID=V5IMR3_NEUCR|nr:hypothetical protein NCU16827 [Neurospora crassa OR74A]ESA42982.1 hypothetical protein NCU16827 [Neurospora crassa OR74A]|eukprot:XP_011394413.1 hypothetical protein NCU16827 [Neurospora crassa OR74A]